MEKKNFMIYMAVAFGGAWILQVIASIFANQGTQNGVGIFKLILAVCMFMPMLAAWVARGSLRGIGFVPHLKGRIRWVFFALFVPAVVGTLGAGLYFAIFPNQYDPGFELIRQSMGEAVVAQLEAQGITMETYLITSSISTLTIAPFFNMFFAVGEETGWRGTLYPYLKEKFGRTKGRILGGICWGAWHFPVMLLAGYEYGKDYLGAPVLGPVVFCLSTICMGILLDHVYEKTETIWAPALMHGAINALTIFVYLVKPEYADRMILGPASIGLIGMIPMALLAICLSLVSCREENRI